MASSVGRARDSKSPWASSGTLAKCKPTVFSLLSRSERRLSSSRPDAIQLVGRTADDRMVVFDGTDELIGQLVHVEIERTSPFTLFGKIATLDNVG